MPTKAELEREVRKLRRQVAEFERRGQEQEESKDSSVATQLDELRQQYNILERRCAELEHMLEEEHMARLAAETVASEVKQELLMYEERCDRRVSQIKEEIESAHKRESDAQADLRPHQVKP